MQTVILRIVMDIILIAKSVAILKNSTPKQVRPELKINFTTSHSNTATSRLKRGAMGDQNPMLIATSRFKRGAMGNTDPMLMYKWKKKW